MNLLARARKGIELQKNLKQIESDSDRRSVEGKENTILTTFRQFLDSELSAPRVSGDVFEDTVERLVESIVDIDKIPEEQARKQVKEALEKSGMKKEFEAKIHEAYEKTLKNISRTVVEVEGKPLLESDIKVLMAHVKEAAKRDHLPEGWLAAHLLQFEKEAIAEYRQPEHQQQVEFRLLEQLQSILSEADVKVIQGEFQQNGIQHLPRIEAEYTPLIDHLITTGKITASVAGVWNQLLRTECLLKLQNEREISHVLLQQEHKLKEYARNAQAIYTREENKFNDLPLEEQTDARKEVLSQFEKERRRTSRVYGRSQKNQSIDLPSVVSVVQQYFPNEGRQIIRDLRPEVVVSERAEHVRQKNLSASIGGMSNADWMADRGF